MKLHADTPTTAPYHSPSVEIDHTKSIRLVTEPNNLGEFIEIQIAELRDGSLNVVISGEASYSKDSRSNPLIHVWPTAKSGEKK